jgi:hypothetical protein
LIFRQIRDEKNLKKTVWKAFPKQVLDIKDDFSKKISLMSDF